MSGGIVAAGHEVTAAAGARVLADGGNAVDAAVAAMLTSWVAEPLLTGPGAGGYLLVAAPGLASRRSSTSSSPRRASAPAAIPGRSCEVLVDFDGETEQVVPRRRRLVRHVRLARGRRGGDASAGGPWRSPSSPPRPRRWPATASWSRPSRRSCSASSPGSRSSSPEGAATFLPGGRPPQAGERLALPELGDAIARLGADGAAPFYTGDIAAAIVALVGERGGLLTADDLAAYEAMPRSPARVSYRGDTVLTNPPPSAGATLLALALGLLDRTPGPPRTADIVDAMATAQEARTDEFVEGLAEPGFLERFLPSRLGATTHISVVDGEGRAASVTCTNGEGSGVVVPGTGVHVNNIMGEEDLSPLGFHTAPPAGGCRR